MDDIIPYPNYDNIYNDLSNSDPKNKKPIISTTTTGDPIIEMNDTWNYNYEGGKTILDLNDDVMFEILKNLTNVRELLRLKSVCKRFEIVVSKYVKFCPIQICNPRHLYYTSEFRKMFEPRIHKIEINFAHLLHNCKRLTHLNALVFTNFVWWDLRKLPGNLPYLVSLEVRASHPTLSNSKLSDLLKRCTKLEKLIIWDFARFNMDFTCLSVNLTCVEFKNHCCDDAVLSLLQKKGSQLKQLRIENAKYNSNYQSRVDKINETNLVKLLEYCPNLESIFLIKYNMLGNLGCLLEVKNLKQLVIDATKVDHRFSREAYMQILINNPSLTHLTIPVHNNDFLDFVKTCALYNPNLQYLDGLTTQLYNDETVNSIIKIWSKFNNLLELNKCTRSKFSLARTHLKGYSG